MKRQKYFTTKRQFLLSTILEVIH